MTIFFIVTLSYIYVCWWCVLDFVFIEMFFSFFCCPSLLNDNILSIKEHHTDWCEHVHFTTRFIRILVFLVCQFVHFVYSCVIKFAIMRMERLPSIDLHSKPRKDVWNFNTVFILLLLLHSLLLFSSSLLCFMLFSCVWHETAHVYPS